VSSQLAAVCPGYRGPTTVILDYLYNSPTKEKSSTSTRTNNWGAVTPKAEPKDYASKGYKHILDWPTYLPEKGERDKNGYIVPARLKGRGRRGVVALDAGA
jgi:hypothetical protein